MTLLSKGRRQTAIFLSNSNIKQTISFASPFYNRTQLEKSKQEGDIPKGLFRNSMTGEVRRDGLLWLYFLSRDGDYSVRSRGMC